MNRPTTHTLPADAFRADRGKTDAAGSMYVEPPEQFTRRDPGSDHLTIEQRLTRLEAWARKEIFARTAMDEPEPVTAVEVNPDDPRLRQISLTELDAEELIAGLLGNEFYDRPSRDWELGFNRGMKRAARLIVAHINARRAPVAKGGEGE